MLNLKDFTKCEDPSESDEKYKPAAVVISSPEKNYKVPQRTRKIDFRFIGSNSTIGDRFLKSSI